MATFEGSMTPKNDADTGDVRLKPVLTVTVTSTATGFTLTCNCKLWVMWGPLNWSNTTRTKHHVKVVDSSGTVLADSGTNLGWSFVNSSTAQNIYAPASGHTWTCNISATSSKTVKVIWEDTDIKATYSGTSYTALYVEGSVTGAPTTKPVYVYDGSSWVKAKKVYVYDGSTWKEAKSISVYNGSSWNTV